jgi:hypothetical protein
MVSPQEGHIKTGALSGTNSGPSIAGVEGAYWAMRVSTETGGSATNSQPPTPESESLSVMQHT